MVQWLEGRRGTVVGGAPWYSDMRGVVVQWLEELRVAVVGGSPWYSG